MELQEVADRFAKVLHTISLKNPGPIPEDRVISEATALWNKGRSRDKQQGGGSVSYPPTTSVAGQPGFELGEEWAVEVVEVATAGEEWAKRALSACDQLIRDHVQPQVHCHHSVALIAYAIGDATPIAQRVEPFERDALRDNYLRHGYRPTGGSSVASVHANQENLEVVVWELSQSFNRGKGGSNGNLSHKVVWVIDNCLRGMDLPSRRDYEEAADEAVLMAAELLSESEMDGLLGLLSRGQRQEVRENTSRRVLGPPSQLPSQ